MGQKLGKCKYINETNPFLNLPESALYKLNESFNSVSEGFGLTQPDFIDICLCLIPYLDTNESSLSNYAKLLFEALDTDNNLLIDSLEFLSSLSFLSSMSLDNKLAYIFKLYDFDDSNAITLDEMTLCLKSAVIGLCKLTNSIPPLEIRIETYALKAFSEFQINKTSTIQKQQFIDFCKRV